MFVYPKNSSKPVYKQGLMLNKLTPVSDYIMNLNKHEQWFVVSKVCKKLSHLHKYDTELTEIYFHTVVSELIILLEHLTSHERDSVIHFVLED